MSAIEGPTRWIERIRAGDRRAIARAISAIENGTAEARALAAQLGSGEAGRAAVVGVTGPPGAGKSTLVNAIVKELVARGHSVAVVAVDPSSPITGGAVLGDRVRMGEVQAEAQVFIRSLAARGHLGGLTVTTRQVIDVLDAAGFDYVIVETVGTGQSEVEIAGIAATRVVVCPPGAGDDVQAIKAGVLEIADVLVVNKADLPDAARTEKDLRAMLALRAAGNRPPVMKTVATSGEGIAALADQLAHHAAAHPRPGRKGAAAAPDPVDAQALQRHLAAKDAFGTHLGLEFVEGGEGRATVRMIVRPEHINFFGAIHGGATFSLADMALGLACNSYGSLAVLIDAHMTFTVAAKEGEVLTATAAPVSRSRKLAVYRIDVSRADGALVASLTGTVYLTGKKVG